MWRGLEEDMTTHEELRVLDKRIAELKRCKIKEENGDYLCMCSLEEMKAAAKNLGGFVQFNFNPISYYSTKIADAWELFEEMDSPYIEKHSASESRTYYEVGNNDEVLEESYSAPEAIARAWIKWKENGRKI